MATEQKNIKSYLKRYSENKMEVKFSDVIKGEGVIILPGCVIGRPPLAPKGVTEIDYSKLPNKPEHKLCTITSVF